MTRTQYHHDLETLKTMIIEMSESSYKLISDAVTALDTRDIELAARVVQGDCEIDEYDRKIERFVSQLIARQNPTARDMRLVTSCFKISIDLERMSDNAVDIAMVVKCCVEEKVEPHPNIFKMAEIGKEMLKQSTKAFETMDVGLARMTAQEDDKIDWLFYETQRELIDMMSKEREMYKNTPYMFYVIRYLERIGDHACNICESVVYMTTGERTNLN